jgi:hypothetical protein
MTMSMLDRFSPATQRSIADAGALARRACRHQLGTDALLLALTVRSGVRPVLERFGADEAAVRHVLDTRWGWEDGPDDHQLLARLGIDLDAVRAAGPAGAGRTRWRLERARLRPLRLCLSSPGTAFILTGQARKVVEVAQWRGRRHGGPATDADLLHAMLCDPHSRSSQTLCELRVCFPSLVDHLDAGPLAA